MKTPSSTSQPSKVRWLALIFLARGPSPRGHVTSATVAAVDVPSDSSLCPGLAVMADRYPERVLQRLLQELRAPSRASSLEIRLKTGEVLMRASRAMGNPTHKLASPCLLIISLDDLLFSRSRRPDATPGLPVGRGLPAGNQGPRAQHPGQQSVQPRRALPEAGLRAGAAGAGGARAT